MISIDLRSLVILNGILALLIGVVMLCLRASYPRSIRGLGYWALASITLAISTVLFVGRGVFPELVAVLLANGVFLLSLWLYLAGLRRFWGEEPKWRSGAVGLAVVLALLAWYTVGAPSYNMRVFVVSIAWSVIMASMVSLLWRVGTPRFSTWFTAIALAFETLLLWTRGTIALWVHLHPGMITPDVVPALYVAANAITLMALGLGLILQAGDRFRDVYEHLASHDPLTDVLTRRSFFAAFSQELARSQRHGRSMALLFIDIDHFKQVNDVHGHQVGDRVLLNLTQRLATLLRRPDLVARLGGEEFAVLLPETTLGEANAVAQRILSHVAEAPQEEGLPSITVSIGVTTLLQSESDIDAVMVRADNALYEAKAQGRNRVVSA